MPLLRKRALLAAKIETTSGTLESFSASDAAFNVFDVSMTPNITFTERQGNGSFSQMPSIAESYGATCTFTTEIYGSGAGGVPGWASTFLPACGWVNTAGTFSPKTDDPGADVKTLSLGLYIDNLRWQMRGCAGTFKVTCESGKLARIEWTYQGVWVGCDDETMLAPTYPTTKPLRVSNATFTIGSASPCFSQLEIDAGNEVFLRACSTVDDQSGLAGAIITGRKVNGTIDPETVLVATKDVWGNWLTSTEEAFSFALENASDKVTFAMPKFQATNIQAGDRDGMLIDTITYQANRSAAAGNDELTIAFAAP